MNITIEAPHLVRQLETAAARQGLSAGDYARQILERQLAQEDAPLNLGQKPTSMEEWTSAFDAWVDSHPTRSALPDGAFERASFYPMEPLPASPHPEVA